MKRLKIVAIGDELLNGAISDTNSAEISRALEPLGFQLNGVTVVPDKLSDIIQALTQSTGGSDLIITTGGLGPTTDDLTRNAVANFVGVTLEENVLAKAKLEAFFKKRERPIIANNYRQIQFPKGAKVITNDIGTADGFISFYSATGLPIISLPGVPRELSWLLKNGVGTWITEHFGPPSSKITRSYLRIFGRSESYLGSQIETLNLSSDFNIAYRPMSPEIVLTVSTETASTTDLRETLEKIKSVVGPEFVYSTSPSQILPESIIALLIDRQKTAAFAESCTGGMLADLLVSVPGVSQTFLASAVTYSNESKAALVDVNRKTLETFGAVSAETAKEMAAGIKSKVGADFGVSITGVAGPDGGTVDKPTGTFFVGFATDRGVSAHKFFMPTERNLFRRYAAYTALDLLRRELTGLPLDWTRQ